jgi:hypothetical protein
MASVFSVNSTTTGSALPWSRPQAKASEQSDAEYWRKTIGGIKTPIEFVKDERLYNFAIATIAKGQSSTATFDLPVPSHLQKVIQELVSQYAEENQNIAADAAPPQSPDSNAGILPSQPQHALSSGVLDGLQSLRFGG